MATDPTTVAARDEFIKISVAPVLSPVFLNRRTFNPETDLIVFIQNPEKPDVYLITLSAFRRSLLFREDVIHEALGLTVEEVGVINTFLNSVGFDDMLALRQRMLSGDPEKYGVCLTYTLQEIKTQLAAARKAAAEAGAPAPAANKG